jgi:ADP-heptose:LPS heptosyltransferase/predicted SAM-dependent methyltransferase
MVWKAGLEGQLNEVAKIRWELPQYTRGFVLDIGCGPNKGFPHFIGVDNRADTKLFNIDMNPDLTVPDASSLKMFADGFCDAVFSSHLLEHIVDHKKALSEWWRLIKVGGYLCLYLPHKKFYPNIGQEWANEDHKHDFLPEDIVDAMRTIGSWDLVRNEDRNQDNEYSFFQVYRKSAKGAGHQFSYKKPRPDKTCGIVRYGAWGDLIQASSILPGLKAQGYHITLYTTPRGHEVIKEDPNVDEFYMQDTDQVPNTALGQFWDNEKKKFDKWINLSESVEATWLAQPDRIQYTWPHDLRDKILGHTNYLEFHHELAGVPYEKCQMRFVPTADERKWAHEQVRRERGDPLIVWTLAGSSIHKVWPHMDQVFARILLTWPKAKIVTMGGQREADMLEGPWENEPRIIKQSGKLSIRQTMALAQEADLVIGPETGVMSAVAMLPMPKIIFLSHSSEENLTRDWVNTKSLTPMRHTPCYPCHKMIYTWDQCVKHEETGVALCATNITPDQCWVAVVESISVECEVAEEFKEKEAA